MLFHIWQSECPGSSPTSPRPGTSGITHKFSHSQNPVSLLRFISCEARQVISVPPKSLHWWGWSDIQNGLRISLIGGFCSGSIHLTSPALHNASNKQQRHHLSFEILSHIPPPPHSENHVFQKSRAGFVSVQPVQSHWGPTLRKTLHLV